MIKAVILDSDDTIINFSSIAASVMQKAARNLKLKVPKEQEINKLWGRSLFFMIDHFWGKQNYNKVKREYMKIISKHKFKEIKGANSVLKELNKKYALGIISAKPRVLMFKHFKDANIDKKMFNFMLSADDTKYHKPDPRVFNGVLRLLRIDKEEVLYVGDTLVDCVAARFAGFNFVAVLTGSYTRKEFLEAGVEKQNILKSIRDLPKWVETNG
jgi:phosphoglycolate phosphatase